MEVERKDYPWKTRKEPLFLDYAFITAYFIVDNTGWLLLYPEIMRVIVTYVHSFKA